MHNSFGEMGTEQVLLFIYNVFKVERVDNVWHPAILLLFRQCIPKKIKDVKEAVPDI